ncbi:HAD-like domain-containing protein, partial [Cercophora scortea]
PNPSPSYLLRASFLALPSPTPRPMLVVIDLNGTLLFRPSRRQPTKFLARPHAHTFLSYCLETFHVVIWSSARPDNVRNMLAALLPSPEQRNRVIAAWGRDKFGLSAEDYNLRTQCYKRLTRLWTDPIVAAAHPDGEPWNQGNTVLIDDSAEKARSEPFNAITIPEFLGDVNEEPEVLPLVHDYLNTLAMQVDISTYIRTKPFKV